MKTKERTLARVLRKKGLSINAIVKQVGVSKSSVSVWVRDIVLPLSLLERLAKRSHSSSAIEKRRIARITNEKAKRDLVQQTHAHEIWDISKNELFLIGIALYWAEGAKRSQGIASISNGDPKLIMVAMRFFREVCYVPEEKFRGYIHIHHHLNHKKAEQYWSRIANIPLRQFYKTYRNPKDTRGNGKDTMPYGTFDIVICDTQLLLKIKGWIQGLTDRLITQGPG